MAQEVYAFGCSRIERMDGVIKCPAEAGGFVVDGGTETTIAERYDRVVRERYGIDEGTLPKSVAKSCWEQAIEELKSDLRQEVDPSHADWLDDSIGVGGTVAERAF